MDGCWLVGCWLVGWLVADFAGWAFLLCWCAAVLVCRYAGVPLCLCAAMPVCRCVRVSLSGGAGYVTRFGCALLCYALFGCALFGGAENVAFAGRAAEAFELEAGVAEGLFDCSFGAVGCEDCSGCSIVGNFAEYFYVPKLRLRCG